MLNELEKLITNSVNTANQMLENLRNGDYMDEERVNFIYLIPALVEQYINLKNSIQ